MMNFYKPECIRRVYLDHFKKTFTGNSFKSNYKTCIMYELLHNHIVFGNRLNRISLIKKITGYEFSQT